jgi:hypothetical protein
VLGGVTIEFSRETTYPGKVLDDKLLWNSQKKKAIMAQKAIMALMAST